ncbi:MAG: NTP transferase domain-containing protein [Gammaproteobacteria bacterium]
MRAVMLAAGVGNRLGTATDGPKSLLTFGGRTLLERHLENLASLGVASLTLCVGYRAELIEAHIENAPLPVRCIHNADYRRGSVVSLWTVREALTCDDDILLMDADVLYAPALLSRLAHSPHPNCFLLDEDFVPGDEPVKICVKNGRIVEFRKRIAADLRYDFWGESVGFFKFGPSCARALAKGCETYVDAGRLDEPYEEIIRDLVLEDRYPLAFERVAALPWLEIDFPEDLVRARDAILPQLDRYP